MEDERFDALVRGLGRGASRRGALGMLAGSTFSNLLRLVPRPANAKKGKGKKRKKKRRARSCGPCTGGTCEVGTCLCSAGTEFCRGSCVAACDPDFQASPATGSCRRESQGCKRSGQCCESMRCQENANGRRVCTRLTDPTPTPTPEPSNGPMPLSDPSGTWTLVFREDFDGASLDTSKWNEQYPWGGSRKACCGEEQYYTTGSRNLEFADGNLSIVARREPITAEGQTHSFSSGLIQNRNKFTFTEGYFEARARMPNESGMWPAFWTLPVDYSGSRPEWDIVECYGDRPSYAAACWHLPGDNNGCANAGTTIGDASQWHIYGFAWSGNRAIWYRDGVEIFRRSGGFAVPSYLLLNLAIHTRGGDPSLGSYPARFDVDYVYAWKRS